jgi:hypothetical protein
MQKPIIRFKSGRWTVYSSLSVPENLLSSAMIWAYMTNSKISIQKELGEK